MPVIRLILLSLFILAVFPLYGRAQTPSQAKPIPRLPGPPAPIQPGQGSISPGARIIEVSGNGEIQAAPDLATLEIAIVTQAATADHAAGLNGALAEKVRDALTSKLAEKGKMWTGGYSLSPHYTEPHDGPALSGYTAENSITVQTSELGLVGPLIDAAIGAGANRISSLQYSLRANSKARSEAIAKAARDAQTQASALAGALGVTLGPVIKASTESEIHPVYMARFPGGAAMAANVETPIAAGQVTVPATVSLTYSIE
jgi:uncharacterized protein YggE